MPWKWLDIEDAPAQIISIPNTDTRETLDFTWMGIRKGGKRWYRPLVADGAFSIEEHDPLTVGPARSFTWAQDGSKTQPRPQGITNDKKQFIFGMRSNNLTNPDWIQFNDLRGNFIRSVQYSDGVTNVNRQLCFLDKYLYVIAATGPFSLKTYDLNGVLVRTGTLPVLAGFANPTYHGITTDGKDLYLVFRLVTVAPAFITTVIKVDAQTFSQVGFYGSPAAGTFFGPGITFQGRYLLIMEQAIPP